MINKSNIRAPVLLNLLNSYEKEIKCSASLAFYLFSSTRLIDSIKHEIFYISHPFIKLDVRFELIKKQRFFNDSFEIIT